MERFGLRQSCWKWRNEREEEEAAEEKKRGRKKKKKKKKMVMMNKKEEENKKKKRKKNITATSKWSETGKKKPVKIWRKIRSEADWSIANRQTPISFREGSFKLSISIG